VHLSDISVTVRNRPRDFALEHLDLELDPRHPGDLSLDRLQLVGGQIWSRLAARTTYTNRNLVVQNLVLANDEQVRSLSIDASQIGARKLRIQFDYIAGAGSLSGNLA